MLNFFQSKRYPFGFSPVVFTVLFIIISCNAGSDSEKNGRKKSGSDKTKKSTAGRNYVNRVLESADRIEIYFPKKPRLSYEREEITPQYIFTAGEDVKRIISYMKEESEYVIAIGKLPAAEIAKSGRMYLFVQNRLAMTINFYRDRANLSVMTGSSGKADFKESDILFSSRKINTKGEKYLNNLFNRVKYQSGDLLP